MRSTSVSSRMRSARRLAAPAAEGGGPRRTAGSRAGGRRRTGTSPPTSTDTPTTAEARPDEPARILLEVAQGDPVQRLLDGVEEPLGVGPVSPLGVAAATVEPEVDQVLVGLGLSGDDKGGRGYGDQPAVRVLGRMQDNTPSRA